MYVSIKLRLSRYRLLLSLSYSYSAGTSVNSTESTLLLIIVSRFHLPHFVLRQVQKDESQRTRIVGLGSGEIIAWPVEKSLHGREQLALKRREYPEQTEAT